MKKNWLILSTGFALFSMFFGSGNLVFPLVVGQTSQGHTFFATLGILLTGVVVPFLGVYAMLLCKGNLNQFFHYFGGKGVFWFSLLTLGLLGPFGVVARCLTVMHGTLKLAFSELSLFASGLVICGVIYFLTMHKNRIVTVVGSALTPFLLLSIAIIAFLGLSQGDVQTVTADQPLQAFGQGFFQGYQTMDLLAAFFFSSFVIQHLKSGSAVEKPFRMFLKASLIGAGLLSIVYFILVLLGWQYGSILAHTPPQEGLGRIAIETLGVFAVPCVCVAVILACLTTAIVLSSLFAEFLKKEICKDKIGSTHALLITLAVALLISTFDFGGIARFLGPILEFIYPALILLTLVTIVSKSATQRIKDI